MNKDEALKWIVETKAISPFTRNFIIWLYKNGGRVTFTPESQKERLWRETVECENSMAFSNVCEACKGTGHISFPEI